MKIMFSFEEFKKVVEERFMEYMPETFQGLELRICEVNKVNEILTGLTLFDNSEKANKKNVSPTIYLEHMYEVYCNSMDIEFVLMEFAKTYADAFENCSNIVGLEIFGDVDSVRKHIVFQMINKDGSERLLNEVPHKEFMNDIAIIYRVMGDKEKLKVGEMYSAVVNYGLLKHYGLSEHELYDLAFENTKRLLPPDAKTMQDILRELMGLPSAEDEELLNVPGMPKMYVISNKQKVWGASVMLYPEVFKKLSDEVFQSDLYILPSSIHECICVSADEEHDLEQLTAMVMEINATEVAPNERLSNQVYFYSRKTGEISATTSDMAEAM